MTALHLALKATFFNQICAGLKPEEFRLCTPYWQRRLVGRQYDQIILTNGYPRRDDTSRRLVLPWRGFSIKVITHPFFGSEPVLCYAIKVAEPNLEAV